MISLSSSEWSNIPDAYGHGDKIPYLLQKVEADSSPKDSSESEPWFSLWSSLCHQGDVYPASFAAVPHLADIASRTSRDFAWDFFALPTAIEIARNDKEIAVPASFAEDYFSSLKILAKLASHYESQDHLDPLFLKTAKAMVLVEKGKFKEAEDILDS